MRPCTSAYQYGRVVTTAELADRVGISRAAMLELLRESEAAGIVEPSSSGWRLTPGAEERFGDALRGLTLPADDRSTSAAHRDDTDLRDIAA